MAADNTSFTISDIKTNETGIWKVVFDQKTEIYFDIHDTAVLSCSSSYLSPSTTECISGVEVEAGSYTVGVSREGNPGPIPWEIVPSIKAFFVGHKSFCEGEICK